MSGFSIAQLAYPAPLVPLPAWVRGILFAVTLDSESQTPADADRRDVEAARRGNGEAYARIIRRHQATIARRMMRFARDRQTIEELVHDCFVEAYLSLRSYRGDSPLEHWLSKIATRVGYRHWKTQRRDRQRIGMSITLLKAGCRGTTTSPRAWPPPSTGTAPTSAGGGRRRPRPRPATWPLTARRGRVPWASR